MQVAWYAAGIAPSWRIGGGATSTCLNGGELMRKRMRIAVAALCATALMAGGTGVALGVGGPNEAGNSGQFHPGSNPCQSDNNHPNCPGPH